MKYNKVSDIEKRDNPHGVEARRLYSNDSVLVMHLTLKTGDTVKPHSSPDGACFFVLSGKGTVTIGDEKREVEANTVIESPGGTDHGWHNSSEADLVIMVIKKVS